MYFRVFHAPTWCIEKAIWSHHRNPSCGQCCTWRPREDGRWSLLDSPCPCQWWSCLNPGENEAPPQMLHMGCQSCSRVRGREPWQENHPREEHQAPSLTLQTYPCHRHPLGIPLHQPTTKYTIQKRQTPLVLNQ